MGIYRFNRMAPDIDSSVFIAPTASIIGNVIIRQNCSIWFNCVIRADGDQVMIGPEANIQDMAMLPIPIPENRFISAGRLP